MFYICMIPILVGLFHLANALHVLVRGKQYNARGDEKAEVHTKERIRESFIDSPSVEVNFSLHLQF